MLCISVVAAVCLCFSSLVNAQELIQNPGFENGMSGWRADGFTMFPDTSVAHTGTVSARCTGRTQAYQGPAQFVPIKQNGLYKFQGYVKLFDTDLAQPVMVKISFTQNDGTIDYFQVAARSAVIASGDWTQLASHFKVPDSPFSQAKLYFEGPAAGVGIYVDDVSLTQIPEDADWVATANQRIDQLRKSNIHFNFNLASNFAAEDLRVQIDHVRHLFGFGTVARADNMVDPTYAQYQNIIYYMFNWATVEDYKWAYDRGTQDKPDYSVAVAATDILIDHGLKVRGHCMFWAVKGNEPSWVTPLTGAQLREAVDNRIKYITTVTKGKLSHWDVDNELLHGNFFETGTGDSDYTQHMFQTVKEADPVPILFLNDYDVVATGGSTLAYLEQIQKFKAAIVGLGGVGVQSHFPLFEEPDVTLMKARLDFLATAGVPIWVTELDLSSDNETLRADWYEKALRLYFSHPAVDGVSFWGFWDHDMDPLKALVHGYSFTLNEAGQRYLHLTKEEWSTHVSQSLSSGTSFDVRGFQGDYEVIVLYHGTPIYYNTFSLGKDDQTVNINILGTGSAIQLPVPSDPFASVNFTIEKTTEGLQDLGNVTSTSESSELQCVTKWSGTSEIGDDKYIDAQCDDGYILTGCSSILDNDDYHRDGEQMIFVNGKATCRAINGYRSTTGVRAIARCCTLKGLSCSYKTAGPSGTSIDAQVYLQCSPNLMDNVLALGCSTWTYTSESDGSFIDINSCTSQNDDKQSGVYAYAACCTAPGLYCATVNGQAGGNGKGDVAMVQCEDGFVMTGCNVFSSYGRAAGAYIRNDNGMDVCYGVNGFTKYGSELGVSPNAACCKVMST